MKVEAVLTHKGGDVVTIAPDATVGEAVEVIFNRRIGAVVVTSDEKSVAGIFSERDLVEGLGKHGAKVLDQPVGQMMTEIIHTCTPDSSVIEVMGLMTRRRIRHIPVMDDGELVGIVSIGDAVKARISETETEAEALKEYIATG